jgi:amino acid adenylation domain-containing protein
MIETEKVSARLATLSPAKRALLELRLQQGRSGTPANMTISRRANRDSAPLSFAQQRLWFLSQLEAESSAYNERSALRLDGHLDVAALRGALNAIVERHEVLRTTYGITDDGEPVQRIGAAGDIELPVIDISEVAENRRDDEVQRIAAELRGRPFDLSKDMPLRLALIRLSPRSHVLVEVKHHIASDGWSSGIFSHELAALYNSLSQGRPNPLSALPIQYADYSLWQREWLQGEVLEKQLAYWKGQLKDIPVLELPMDRPRSALANHAGAKKTLILSETLTDRLKALSNQQGVTLFMTLLAAFHVLLHRYTGQDDVAVGSPIAGRTRSETEGMIGFFVNTLVLRAKLSGNPTFKEVLARTRETALQAYEHQDLPFEKLVEDLHPERDQHQTPFFQVMFAVQNVPRANLDMPGLKVAPVEIDSSAAKFDIFAAFIEHEREMLLRLVYRAELFEAATIERMLGNFQTLLEGIVANPEQRIGELPLLTEAEKHQILVQWNGTKRDYPSDKSIHQLFEEQVEKSPDGVALVFERHPVTYRELNGRANQLAKYLQRRGVGRGALVAICLDRSVELIVGLLAILKAGGAYVPMDPDYPADRLEFLLRDTGAAVLITEQKMLAQIPVRDVEIVLLDRDAREILNERDDNLDRDVAATGDDLAYVIYTSGSTGNPKGVEVCHRGVNRLLFGVDYARFGAGETFAHLAATSFDASTFEIWGALLHGAKCVLYPQRIPAVKELGDFLHEHKVTTLWFTSSLFNVVIDQAPEALANVRQLLIGGEALSVPHVRRGLALLPHTQIINCYGPTESTTFTSCYGIPLGLDASAVSIPIGRPIGNTQVYLLDSRLAPVPVGIAGELYIGGAGLARGYLSSPQLTGEKFIANPFTDEPGAKLYKTGDLARYLPDGNIEFIGRIDNQVKVRGFRIELGEIEAVLAQHSEVKECVVLARETSPGEKHLAAYVVPAGQQAPQAGELRNFLKTKLPDFMLPSTVSFLDSLPLMTNGKVDRKSLLGLSVEPCGQNHGYVAPRNDLEEKLAVIWSAALRVERIGIHDNFFELGGHSLMAVRVVSEVEKRMGKYVPLALLFRFPTIAQLAGELRPASHSETASSVIAVQPNGSKEPLFCIHGYGAYAQLARDLAPDRPVYGIGKHYTGKRVLRTQVEVLAKEYLKSILAIQPRGPYHLAGHSYGGLVAYEIAQLLQKDGHEVAFMGLIDTLFPKPRKSIIQRFRLNILDKWYALARLTGAARMGYLAQTVKLSAQWRLKALQCFGYHLIRRKPPPELLEFYIDEILFDRQFAKAQARYRPRPYSGVVHYFKAAENRKDLVEWQAITNRRLVLHEIPGSHTSIMLEPGLVELSRSIAACLAQSAANQQRSSHYQMSPGNPVPIQPAVVYPRTALHR